MLRPAPAFIIPYPPFSASERESAARLGEVYSYIWRERGLPLGDWALPSSIKSGLMHAALGSVYKSDLERGRSMRRYRNRYELYQADFASVMPLLTQPALSWALANLDAEDATLADFEQTLKDPSIKQELAAAVQRIRMAVGAFGTRDPAGLEDIAGERSVPRIDAQRWSFITQAVREEENPILNVLFLHPNCLWILRAYADSADIGTRIAVMYVRSARSAVAGFRASISAPDRPLNVWRYPLLLFGATALRGVEKVPGLPNFAASIGPAYSRSPAERTLSDAQFIILCLGLAFGATEMLAGAAVVSATEMFLAIAQAGFAYMREREQDLGAQASALRPDGQRFAPAATYEDTLMYAAAAILAGIAMFRGTMKFLEAVKMKRLAKLEELKPVTAKSDLANPPRGPLDGGARGTAGNDASVGRANGASRGNRATASEPAGVAARQEEVAAAKQAAPTTPTTAKPPQSPPPTKATMPAKAPSETAPASSAPKQSERLSDRSAAPKPTMPPDEEQVGARGGGRSTEPKRELPPYPRSQYEKAGHGGTPRVREVDILETEEATKAHEGRLSLMREGKIDYKENIAVIKYRNPRTQQLETAWAKSNGDEHAERVLEDWLKQQFGPQYDPGMIEKLYTERIPCGPESKNCYGWMRGTLRNATIEYSFFTRYAGSRTATANDELIKFYIKNFDRLGNRQFPKDLAEP